VKPRFCVISSRSGNPVRFPHSETLERLEQVGCRVLRIDRLGSVTLSATREELEIKTHRGGELDETKETARDVRGADPENEESYENE
jgi:beta-lactamase superfamily II metal-dependent hydrolase